MNNDRLKTASAASIDVELREACTMGVGCEEYGVCFAEAHGDPTQCPKMRPCVAAIEAGRRVLQGEGDGTYDEALDAIRQLSAALPLPKAMQEEGEPSSSAEFHQRRGMLADVILAALHEYDEWMLDDRYDYDVALSKVIAQLERARDVVALPITHPATRPEPVGVTRNAVSGLSPDQASGDCGVGEGASLPPSIRRAAKAICDKLDEAMPHISSAIFIAANHHCEYAGPTIDAELAALKAALSRPEAGGKEAAGEGEGSKDLLPESAMSDMTRALLSLPARPGVDEAAAEARGFERARKVYEPALEEWMFRYYWRAEDMHEQARVHAKTQLKMLKAAAINAMGDK